MDNIVGKVIRAATAAEAFHQHAFAAEKNLGYVLELFPMLTQDDERRLFSGESLLTVLKDRGVIAPATSEMMDWFRCVAGEFGMEVNDAGGEDPVQ